MQTGEQAVRNHRRAQREVSVIFRLKPEKVVKRKALTGGVGGCKILASWDSTLTTEEW